MPTQKPEKIRELCSRVDTSTRTEIIHSWNLIFNQRLLQSGQDGQVQCPMSHQMEAKAKCHGCQWLIQMKDENDQASIICQPPII